MKFYFLKFLQSDIRCFKLFVIYYDLFDFGEPVYGTISIVEIFLMIYLYIFILLKLITFNWILLLIKS